MEEYEANYGEQRVRHVHAPDALDDAACHMTSDVDFS